MVAGHQVVLRLAEDISLAPSVSARRRLASIVLTVARPFGLLSFRWADTHGHMLTVEDRAAATEVGRRVAIALALALKPDVPFQPCRVTPVKDVWHLKSTFLYLLKQDEHHGFAHDRAHEASSAPDQLGLRVIGTWTAARVREALPRLRRADLLEALRWRDPDREGVEIHGDLADAGAAAIGVAALVGRAPLVVAARRAAIEVARGTWTDGQISERLGITVRAVRRLGKKVADKALVRAIRQQLVLRAGHPTDDSLP
jgi:hypothetical protein